MLVTYRKLLRFAGASLWLFLLTATRYGANRRDNYVHPHNDVVWFLCWICFGFCFFKTTSSEGVSRKLTYLLCGAETAIALYFAWLQPDSSITFLLVFIAWQMALLFPPRIALGWIMGQSLAHIFVNKVLGGVHVMDFVQYVIYYGFKTFTCVIVLLARDEAEARTSEALTHSQLEATRELLLQNGRAHERLRISRDLHDVVGHRLTALFLHLEVARNTQNEEQVQLQLLKAQQVSKELLAEVRGVVQELRFSNQIDLRGALSALAEDLPGLRVHLAVPNQLAVDDAAQADVLIRCVQEIITNTLKHAGASELWISLALEQDAVSVRAHDNGRSTGNNRNEGFGINGMRERFMRYGGSVLWDDQTDSGFSLMAYLPLVHTEGPA